ncbi:MAG: DoxX family protein [Moraxellaceae bacterium]|nr:DoxX family protein [Moraxellaceae bacterium]
MRTEDFGKLVLRLAIGILMLLHGLGKLSGGIGFIEGSLVKAGLPGFIAYGVYIGEILAPVLLIVGYWTRPAALIVAVNMVFAIALVHMNELFSLTRNGAWALELQGLFLFGALAVALLGAGRISLGGRFN